jgi:hypothetical protein
MWYQITDKMMDTWKMLYAGMYSSKINNNVSLALPETV